MKKITTLLLLFVIINAKMWSQNPMPYAWKICDNDESVGILQSPIFNKSDERFIYILNRTATPSDSMNYIQLDVLTGQIVKRLKFPKIVDEDAVSPDMKWFFHLPSPFDRERGIKIGRLDTNIELKEYFKGETVVYCRIDSINKKLFVSRPTKFEGELFGSIWVIDYEKKDSAKKLIGTTSGSYFEYDYKRNWIVTLDHDENSTTQNGGYLTWMQVFDASNGKLIHKTVINSGSISETDKRIYYGRFSPSGDKIRMVHRGNYYSYDIPTNTYEIEKRWQMADCIFDQSYYYKNDSMTVCMANQSCDGDSLRIVVVNTYTVKKIFDKVFYKNLPNYISDFNDHLSSKFGIFQLIGKSQETSNEIYCDYAYKLEDGLLDFDHETQDYEILYPNPSSGQLQILLTNNPNSAFNIQLFNYAGEKIKTISNIFSENNKISLDISDLSNGNYLLRLDGLNYTKSFKLNKGE